VQGGLTRPQNAKENTVWVRTDSEIGEVFVQSSQPTATAIGDIWIDSDVVYSEIGAPDNFGDYAVNITDRIYIKVTNVNVKVWDGSYWVFKLTDIYKNKSWSTSDDVKIYGVSWDGTSTTAWTRTDDAANFDDPVPYVSGATSYSSPFDNIMPWMGMVINERTGGTMVSIPKFYYRLKQNGNGLSIQISNELLDDFHVSPAHMDRGDGHGERDVVYIGRYYSGIGSYKSKSGTTPSSRGATITTTKKGCEALGSSYWMQDFTTRFTIWLLYLVEFANWNSQAKIGYGVAPSGNTKVETTGSTDSMPYHTGTMLSSRASFGYGQQYRNIEDLWGSGSEVMDGGYCNSTGWYIILNPEEFSFSSGGTFVEKLPDSGFASKFKVSSPCGYPMFYSTENNGSYTTYSCDYWEEYNNNVLTTGGNTQYGGNATSGGCYGLFKIGNLSSGTTYSSVTTRLMELP
jgi:hypothetical protein